MELTPKVRLTRCFYKQVVCTTWLAFRQMCEKKTLLEHCDWQCYLDRYSDLQDTIGDDLVAAEDHWNNIGRSEGRDCACGKLLDLFIYVIIRLGSY